MSLLSEIQAAATEAQATLVQLGGAAPGKKNSVYQGRAVLAVYGVPVVERIPLPTGGYRQRAFLTATVTRDQFSAPPVSSRTWTRTDLSPAVTYTIHEVGTHDALVFSLTLVKAGT
jgi:hypothetical protein